MAEKLIARFGIPITLWQRDSDIEFREWLKNSRHQLTRSKSTIPLGDSSVISLLIYLKKKGYEYGKPSDYGLKKFKNVLSIEGRKAKRIEIQKVVNYCLDYFTDHQEELQKNNLDAVISVNLIMGTNLISKWDTLFTVEHLESLNEAYSVTLIDGNKRKQIFKTELWPRVYNNIKQLIKERYDDGGPILQSPNDSINRYLKDMYFALNDVRDKNHLTSFGRRVLTAEGLRPILIKFYLNNESGSNQMEVPDT